MSLAPDLQDIFGSYEFCEEERKQLINYFEETKKQTARQIITDDADWNKTILLSKELSNDASDMVHEIIDYTMAWHYSDQDLVDMDEEIIKLLKGGVQ